MRVKTEKYASMLLKEINDVIYNEIRDRDIMGTTVTFLKLSDDFSYAKIYCSVFNEEKKVKSIKELNNAKGYIRSILCKRKLPLRKIPDLEFVYDNSIEYGMEMDKIIEETTEKSN